MDEEDARKEEARKKAAEAAKAQLTNGRWLQLGWEPGQSTPVKKGEPGQSTPVRKGTKSRSDSPPPLRRMTRSQKGGPLQGALNFSRHRPRATGMEVEPDAPVRKTSVKAKAHARGMRKNLRKTARTSRFLGHRRRHAESPNTSFKNAATKWKRAAAAAKKASNAANARNAREFARLEREAAAAAAAAEGVHHSPQANGNWGGEAEEEASNAARRVNNAEERGNSVLEMFKPEKQAPARNQGSHELQMKIDDKYRELVEDDNQAVAVRVRLQQFLKKGGIELHNETFKKYLEHAKHVYELQEKLR